MLGKTSSLGPIPRGGEGQVGESSQDLPKPSHLIGVDEYDLNVKPSKLLRDLFRRCIRVGGDVEAKLEPGL